MSIPKISTWSFYLKLTIENFYGKAHLPSLMVCVDVVAMVSPPLKVPQIEGGHSEGVRMGVTVKN